MLSSLDNFLSSLDKKLSNTFRFIIHEPNRLLVFVFYVFVCFLGHLAEIP